MRYVADVHRGNPTLIVFLVDFSVLAKKTSEELNKFLYNLTNACTRSDGTRNDFYISVLGYHNDLVYNAFEQKLSVNTINSIAEIESSPLRVEDRKKKIDDGAGGLIEIAIKFPIWFEVNHKSQKLTNNSNAFNLGLVKSAEILVDWCEKNSNSYPPTLINIGTGDSVDFESEKVVSLIKRISTNDGEVVFCNVDLYGNDCFFCESCISLQSSKRLYRLSSIAPLHYQRRLTDLYSNQEQLTSCYFTFKNLNFLFNVLSGLVGSDGGWYRTHGFLEARSLQ